MSELAKKYDSAETLDELLYIAGERTFFSAASIAISLKYPKRGRLILKALKKIKPSSYDAFWNQTNRVFAQSLLYVIDRVRAYSENEAEKFQQEHLTRLYVNAGVYYYKELEMSKDEYKKFKEESIRALLFHQKNTPKDDIEQIDRIIEAHEREISTKELQQLMMATTAADSLAIIEPWALIPNYKRLLVK